MKLDEIKLGIVGLGGYSAQYLKIYKNHPKITYLAAAEFYEDRREKYAHYFDRVYSSFDEMLALDREINCVGIFAQRHQHGPLIIQALRAGYNVMTAVPMGCTIEEIKEIVTIITIADACHEPLPTPKGNKKADLLLPCSSSYA